MEIVRHLGTAVHKASLQWTSHIEFNYAFSLILYAQHDNPLSRDAYSHHSQGSKSCPTRTETLKTGPKTFNLLTAWQGLLTIHVQRTVQSCTMQQILTAISWDKLPQKRTTNSGIRDKWDINGYQLCSHTSNINERANKHTKGTVPVHDMKVHWGNRGKAPPILDLGTRWRW